MTLKSNKTPGADGLSLNFYRKFYKDLKEPLLNLYKYSIQEGRLNKTARYGIINLIQKKGKDDLLIKNWRPITLLNYYYKILSKLISNRMELVVGSLIGPQQTGFIKKQVNTAQH